MNNAYGRVHDALDQLLVEKEHAIAPPPANSDPLFLLLTSKPDLIGFAQLNGEGKSGVSRALENFKSLYLVNSSNWADFDLTLVFCRTPSASDSDTFWTEVELDPYFCRKFVIDLTHDIRSDLARLPFIPLQPETVVGLGRPPSAQTLLIDHGVSAWLAEALAVPHRLGEKRIVEECLGSPAGVPELQGMRSVASPKASLRGKPRVRLKELEISNFRAYRETKKFDLDANLIVLYGPNGLGKTSFFDAIDFVCTGGVTRFDERFGRRISRLVDSLKHLDASKEESVVKATLSINGQAVQLERRLDNRTDALIENSIQNRTSVLTDLTDCSVDTSDMRVDNLVRLFRATHLFGQEYQILTYGLREESTLPEDTVSRMLAFQDYVEAINKAERVRKELRQLREDCELRLGSLNESLELKESEETKFVDLKEVTESPQSLDLAGKELLRRISKETDLSSDTTPQITPDEIKAWRGLLEGRIGWMENHLLGLQRFQTRLPEVARLREEFVEEGKRIGALTKDLGIIELEEKRKKDALESAGEKRNEILASEKNAVSRQENLQWLISNGTEYLRIKSEILKADEERQRSQRRILELAELIGRHQNEGNRQRGIVQALTTQGAELERQLFDVTELLRQIDDWKATSDRLINVNGRLQTAEAEMEKLANDVRVKRGEVVRAENLELELEKSASVAQQHQTDFQRLLETSLNYIADQHCPVCGADHGSKETVVSQIRDRIGATSTALTAALENLRGSKAKTADLRTEVGRLEGGLASLQQEINSLKTDREQLTNRLRDYEQKARRIEVLVDHGVPSGALNAKQEVLSQAIKDHREELAKKQSQLRSVDEQAAILSQAEEKLSRDQKAKDTVRTSLSQAARNIEGQALNRHISINEDEEATKSELKKGQQLLSAFQESLKKQEALIARIEGEHSELIKSRDKLRREIQSLTEHSSALGRSINEFEGELSKLELKKEIEARELQVMIHQTEETLPRLESLKEELVRFELALDEVQISASLARLRQERDDLRKQASQIEKEQAQIAQWERYFDKVRQELEGVQKRSLKQYIEKYGPLASSIQKRLRAVYGFGDLQLLQEKGKISLRVERKNHKNLTPSDYFSESQIQIVTLSLFLSAVLTQTWSAFAPILLDDPVTHFDDLNAYSLLDVIRGLIDKPGEGHQFILSTCEERLYRLMRQKFARLEGRAVYYEFSSIGEHGPTLELVS